jgi:hypothetical protein
LGTVKTICSRSGAFRDNQTLRALCTLPPIQQSESTTLIVPDLPPQDVVTGDNEVDAVLWLRQVISTGQAALIEKAMLAAKWIKTPLAELEKRYRDHLVAQSPGHFAAAWGSFGFADLEELVNTSTEKLTRQHEALSRFGSVDALFLKTSAEQFCIDALAGLKRKREFGEFDNAQVDQRFQARHDLIPQTLSDCLHELAYWDNLYTIRQASHDNAGDHWPEVQARDDFVFRSLARIRARTKEEAVAVFRYLADSEHMDREEANDILSNLMDRRRSETGGCKNRFNTFNLAMSRP